MLSSGEKLPRYVRCRDGGFYVRMGVPAHLRPYIGRSELNEPVGTSRTVALRRHHAVVARFVQQLAEAQEKFERKEAPSPAPRTRTTRSFAARMYAEQAELDHAMRSAGTYREAGIDPRDFTRLFADGYEAALREVAAGVADDEKIAATIGWAVTELDPSLKQGAVAWRDIARQLAGVQIEVVQRRREADHGTPPAKPTHPLLTASDDAAQAPVSINGLFADYCAELARLGKGDAAAKRWRPAFAAFVKHLGHDDATRVSRSDIIAFADSLKATLSPRTIHHVHVACLKCVFGWAADRELIKDNPAQRVKVRVEKAISTREQGYTEDEAKALIAASRSYEPKSSANPRTRESTFLTAAKRWAPLLCAHTGARIAEITQLRKCDVMDRDGIPHVRITPEAGSVKTGQFRDVPLHPEIVTAGFLAFVQAAPDGPLFFDGTSKRKAGGTHPSKTVSGRLSQWLGELKVVPEGVDANHGWRHRFKTISRELKIDPRVADAIQGHAPRTAGEGYGDVKLSTKAAAIAQFPTLTR